MAIFGVYVFIILLCIIAITIAALLLLAVLWFIKYLRTPRAPAYVSTLQENGKYRTQCVYCNHQFDWQEQDALVKYASTKGYLVPCPHCNKLLHLYDE